MRLNTSHIIKRPVFIYFYFLFGAPTFLDA